MIKGAEQSEPIITTKGIAMISPRSGSMPDKNDILKDIVDTLREPEDDPDMEYCNEVRRYISDEIEKKIQHER